MVAEGTALLMGSVLMFAMLALAMIATRRFDWRKMTRAPQTATHQ
ncbi:MAG: inner membrane CreD family protein [Burkholderiaceae bacterium]|nr:inner membrane CreD family protein [Burkholderiaceae bacterium]